MSTPIRTLKVYIAAPYPLMADARAAAVQLEAASIDVTSRWLTCPDEMRDDFARMDLADVEAADAIVALNPAGWENQGTGGRHVEFGYALAHAKRVVIVGVRSNLFHHLARVCVMPTLDVEALRDWVTRDLPNTAITRFDILARARASRAEIEQIFTDCAAWNEDVRPPGAAPLDPDPDGELRALANRLDALLATDAPASPVIVDPADIPY